MKSEKTLKPDAKGRVCLGDLAKDISSFRVRVDSRHRIILEPFVEIPAREQWLFKNKTALAQVKQGIQDAAKGKLKNKGDFSQFQDEELED